MALIKITPSPLNTGTGRPHDVEYPPAHYKDEKGKTVNACDVNEDGTLKEADPKA